MVKKTSVPRRRRLELIMASLLFGIILSAQQTALATCSEELQKLVGFTIIAAAEVTEESQQQGGKVLLLQNGMAFWIQPRSEKERFDYGPTAIVFYRVTNAVPMPIIEHRLLIDDDLYMCRRLK